MSLEAEVVFEDAASDSGRLTCSGSSHRASVGSGAGNAFRQALPPMMKGEGRNSDET